MPRMSTTASHPWQDRPSGRLPRFRSGFRIALFLMLIPAMATVQEARGRTPVIIGVATSTTTLEGRESLLAARLAVEEINRRGGVRIDNGQVQLRIETVDLKDADPHGREETALARLETFLETHRVRALVVGPFRSEVLLPAMDVIARMHIPMIGTIAMTPAMESKVMKTPDYRYIFRTGLDTRYLADALIASMRFLNRRYDFQRVFIMIQDVAWARSTASLMIKLYFKRAGWKILGIHHYPYETADFSAGLEEATRKGAQVILPIFDTPHSGQLVIQWKTHEAPGLLCGFISPMMGPGAWNHFDGRIGGALNLIFELGNIPSQRFPPASRFYDAFDRRYGREIEAGHGPAPAYEAVYLLAQAMEKSGSVDPGRLVLALEKSDRLGAMGLMRFNKGHQVIFGTDPQDAAVACLIQWRESGRRVIVYPPALAEGEIELPQPHGQ
jgi:branched-chain amino acid transport system substrate-binding protein